MKQRAIFLDRDGVINKDLKYLYKIEDFIFINGIFKVCQHLQNLDYKIFIITNHSGISRGYYTQSDYQILSDWMISEFSKNSVTILDIFHCPHLPNSNCDCRKPNPGMLIEAKYKHNIDMQNSWMIGDKESDVQAAISSGVINTILLESGHKINKAESQAKYIISSIEQTNQIIIN